MPEGLFGKKHIIKLSYLARNIIKKLFMARPIWPKPYNKVELSSTEYN